MKLVGTKKKKKIDKSEYIKRKREKRLKKEVNLMLFTSQKKRKRRIN